MTANSLATLAIARFYEPQTPLRIACMRLWLFGFFIYKLLSRDFGLFGYAPSSILDFYPAEQFPASLGYALWGFRWIVDLATFHWVHWLFPLSNFETLQAVQCAALVLCAAVCVFGRGPRGSFAIGAYALLMYLWGFVLRSGAELDGICPLFQLVLAYAFYTGPEVLVVSDLRKGAFRKRATLPDRKAGAFLSLCLLLVAAYYFNAGINKVVDIPITGWLRFDVIGAAIMFSDWYRLGFIYWTPEIPDGIETLSFLDTLAVPVVYLMELTVPIVFFRRDLIVYYAAFFVVFHLITWSLIAFFYGLIFLWAIFLPFDRMILALSVWRFGRAAKAIENL